MDGWIRKETETVTVVTERNGVVLLTFPALDRLGWCGPASPRGTEVSAPGISRR